MEKLASVLYRKAREPSRGRVPALRRTTRSRITKMTARATYGKYLHYFGMVRCTHVFCVLCFFWLLVWSFRLFFAPTKDTEEGLDTMTELLNTPRTGRDGKCRPQKLNRHFDCNMFPHVMLFAFHRETDGLVGKKKVHARWGNPH